MNESFRSQAYLEREFKDLAGKLENELAHVTPPRPNTLHIQDEELSADIGQPSPLAKFINNVRGACENLIKSPTPIEIQSRSTIDKNAEFFTELEKQIASVTGTMTRKKQLGIAALLLGDKRFKDLPVARDLMDFTQLKNLDQAVEQLMSQRSMQSTTQHILSQIGRMTGLNAVSGNMPTEDDWNKLQDAIVGKIEINKVCGCSLIYSYWLDEGGLQIAIERIADRVENGIVSNTEALRTLHINETSTIVDIVSSFIVSWQRGELFDVDARRKQYQAQYGFPLHAARAWGSLSTGDPRSIFPGAFHRFLYEASRYYDAQRDRLKVPDIEATRSATGQLLDALREGNENLRKKRTVQVRAFSEYCKRLLGGSQQNPPIALEWSKHLTGRPGITEAPDAKPWQIKVDAVATAYGWSHPRVKEYTTLAEAGETILVATRIGGKAATEDTGTAKAFAELVRPYVQNYVNGFKIVGGLDLGRNLVTAAPAMIMARNVRPPAIPPLKRHWAAVAPAANQSSAA